MQPPYDAAFREAIRLRMSPPNRERVAQIARETGITTQTTYNWTSQWQKQGQLVPTTSQPPEQWSSAAKLATICHGKRRYGLDLIREKLAVTQASTIAINVLVLNLQKLLEIPFVLIAYWLQPLLSNEQGERLWFTILKRQISLA
jgi:transposase-like protein